MDDITLSRTKFTSFDLDGNNLALDFVNTVEYRDTEKEIEWLSSYLDSLCWAEHASILTTNQTAKLIKKAKGSDVIGCYHQVRTCRETLHSLFSHIIDGKDSDQNERIREFNLLYQTVHRRIEVSYNTKNLLWSFPDIELEPLGFLQPVLQAAADLLISGDLKRLKRCSDPICGWLYYDTSKNNSRRWCSMKTCGNRAKVNKFYQSHK